MKCSPRLVARPSNGRDWEARLHSDFATSPNRRARPTDYPINDDNSPIKVVNFNGADDPVRKRAKLWRDAS